MPSFDSIYTNIFLSLLLSTIPIVQGGELPIVDLGYERHQAIGFDDTAKFYNFSNIRYGQAPVGELRFRAPVAPSGLSSTINNGSIGRICPQASGGWTIVSQQFATAYLQGKAFDRDAAFASLPSEPDATERDPRTTEDCLFLDVYVPSQVFDGTRADGLPVLLYITGGGFSSGEKNGQGKFNPTGLLRAGNNGFIFVSINYRLGAFGFLAGSGVAADGTQNAGLYDQRLALKWVQENIHKFGGNKSRVTVLGKSAGAGSLMHQITAFGDSNSECLFQQAIISSPAFQPMPTLEFAQQVETDFLSRLGVNSLAEARELPTDVLIRTNEIQIYQCTYGSNCYGPVIDGKLSPSLPGQLLSSGKFQKSLNVIVAHNLNEALLFTDPSINTTEAYQQHLFDVFPHISTEQLNYISNIIYPPVFNGSYGYKSQYQRAVATTADYAFICNTNYVARAYNNKPYAWRFSVQPALHGADTNYFFYDSAAPTTSLNTTVAAAIQDYVASFVISGAPTGGSSFPAIPHYGTTSQLMDLSGTGIGLATDDTATARCAYWQKALYY